MPNRNKYLNDKKWDSTFDIISDGTINNIIYNTYNYYYDYYYY